MHPRADAQPLLATLLGTSVLGGCKLTKLWDFPLGECNTSSDCLALAEDGQPPSCQEHLCQAQGPDDRRVCMVVPVEEVCDGSDNDCDGVVDERSAGMAVVGQTTSKVRDGRATEVVSAAGVREVVVPWPVSTSAWPPRAHCWASR